jgi:hypothetical protein
MSVLAPWTVVCLSLSLSSLCAVYAGEAQSSGANSGTVRGTVLDPSGAAVQAVTVIILNPVSHYTRSAASDAQGHFEFDNIPFNNYHLTLTATGFQATEQDVNVRSPVPQDLKISLQIGTSVTSVTVEAG